MSKLRDCELLSLNSHQLHRDLHDSFKGVVCSSLSTFASVYCLRSDNSMPFCRQFRDSLSKVFPHPSGTTKRQRTYSERIVILLIESGFVYLIFWVKYGPSKTMVITCAAFLAGRNASAQEKLCAVDPELGKIIWPRQTLNYSGFEYLLRP